MDGRTFRRVTLFLLIYFIASLMGYYVFVGIYLPLGYKIPGEPADPIIYPEQCAPEMNTLEYDYSWKEERYTGL